MWIKETGPSSVPSKKYFKKSLSSIFMTYIKFSFFNVSSILENVFFCYSV